MFLESLKTRLNTRSHIIVTALFLLSGAVFSFIMASIIVSGWPTGLVPSISFPYVYAGDAIGLYAAIQRSIEGSIFTNERQGFPFGAEWYDFPSSDAGNIFVFKILGIIFDGYYEVANIYFLAGFSLTFSVAFYLLRKVGVRNSLSFVAAVIFVFAPYHFSRLLMGHFFYTWYFTVPLYFYCGYLVYKDGEMSKMDFTRCAIVLAVAACFGVYFALFGVFTIMLCGLASTIRKSTWRPIITASVLSAVIGCSVAANVAPNLIYWMKNGTSTCCQRVPVMTEVYSLKPIHLLIPPPNHRIEQFANFSKHYASTFPLSNTVSSVGLIGVVGLTVLASAFIKSLVGVAIDGRIGLLVILAGGSLLVSTVGGLNVLFASFVSPMIRGWDRFSIFILFYAVVALFIWLDARWKKIEGPSLIVLIFGTGLALLDQTPRSISFTSVTNKDKFLSDRKLIAQIENSLPRGAAIYQIPYVDFPEAAPLHKLSTYDPMVGFINSRELKWSSGGMLGRNAMAFYKSLSQRPLSEQVQVVKTMGFSGIYVQNLGYADGGASVVAQLTRITGNPPAFTGSDGTVSYFKIH